LNSRQRSVLIRMIISFAVFAYIGYLAWQQLPVFDFKVIIAFFTIYLLCAISEVFIYKDPDTYVIEDEDRKSYLYLQLSFLVALFYAAIDFVEYHYTRVYSLEPAIIVTGFFIFLFSWVIRWWGFRSIDKYFNPRVAIYEEHQLITWGAYKNIRHPLYLGAFLSSLSLPLIFNSWGALLITLCTTIPALVYRINIEEEFMLRHFGDEYARYMERSRKMIPGIW